MHTIFKILLPEEYDLLKDAIPLITILIAGADGNIDSEERSWAEKVTNIRSYSLPEEYRGYYTEIGQDFGDRLDVLLADLPDNVIDRQMEITRRMGPINDILSKLEKKVAAAIYDEMCSFAKHVARASGGFLKFWSISREEKKWIGLPMLKTFTWYPEDDANAEEE
ncbi:MAG: hypothetical protein DRI69_04015 [Bacteroidetes bacterium]|nr:MAG: hypothetical protein DRI69_04015 [Bacteroidota bacterium]